MSFLKMHLFMQVLLALSSERTGQYVRGAKHTDHQGHTTAVYVSAAFVGWTIIVLGESYSQRNNPY
jgi:hypothetical protein